MSAGQAVSHPGTLVGSLVGFFMNLFGQAAASDLGHTLLVIVGSVLAAVASTATTRYLASRQEGRSPKQAFYDAIASGEDAAMQWANDYLTSRGHKIIPPAAPQSDGPAPTPEPPCR